MEVGRGEGLEREVEVDAFVTPWRGKMNISDRTDGNLNGGLGLSFLEIYDAQ